MQELSARMRIQILQGYKQRSKRVVVLNSALNVGENVLVLRVATRCGERTVMKCHVDCAGNG